MEASIVFQLPVRGVPRVNNMSDKKIVLSFASVNLYIIKIFKMSQRLCDMAVGSIHVLL
jgi:hypothetical protein